MTIKECIDIVDNAKPNQYGTKEKVMWLSFIDEIIINDVLKTHEGYDGRYDEFSGYSEDKISVSLIVPSPYDRLYTAYLKMRIDGENGETARYNNSAALFNSYMAEYRKHYNKTHMPLSTNGKPQPPRKQGVGLSEIELENLKRELYAQLSENMAQMTSPDKIYDIVTNFINNNLEMLRGKDGTNGVDGKDGKDGIGVTHSWNGETLTIHSASGTTRINLFGAGGLISKVAQVTLDASKWIGTSSPYSQVVSIAGVTKNSKIDLNPTVEQLNIFRTKDLAFVVGNNNGIITVYCIGQKPTNDYAMQVTITEVANYG